MTKNCDRCNWLQKYGIDFIKNYGKLDLYSLSKFLNIDIQLLKYDNNYKILRDKLNNE